MLPGTVQTLKELTNLYLGNKDHIFIGGIDGCSDNLDLIKGATDQTSGQPVQILVL